MATNEMIRKTRPPNEIPREVPPLSLREIALALLATPGDFAIAAFVAKKLVNELVLIANGQHFAETHERRLGHETRERAALAACRVMTAHELRVVTLVESDEYDDLKQEAR
jgi:hypothetical protein